MHIRIYTRKSKYLYVYCYVFDRFENKKNKKEILLSLTNTIHMISINTSFLKNN